MIKQTLAYTIGNSLYLNITDRCTLVCKFCPKTQQQPVVHGVDLSLDHRPQVSEIIAAIGNPMDYEEVVFCGFGESTLRLKTLLEVAHWVKENGARVRLNTDGLANLVNKRNVLPELSECVDALSISMNADTESVYNKHCQPRVAGSWYAMLDFIQQAPMYIKDVTATAIDGLHGVDIIACEQLAKQRNVKFRRRELDVVG